MYQFEKINSVHIEITSKCNAACPMCLRNVKGGRVNPYLPITSLTTQDIQYIFDADLIHQLKRIHFIGNYGDPILAPDLLETIQYFRSINPYMRVHIHTNGGVRATEWWERLARIATRVVFGIDGLEDTNHIYRRGVNWKMLMRNVESFIQAGGHAEWMFIVFKHNEHQIEEARDLASRMGFKKFSTKKTGRFFSNMLIKGKDVQEVWDAEGNLEYYLEKPTHETNVNSALKNEININREFGNLEEYLTQTEIDCKVLKETSFYLSAEGLVFPCCWTAGMLYPWNFEENSSQIWDFLRKLPEGKNSINARKYPLRQILKGPFFEEHIPRAWERGALDKERLFICSKTSGKKFNPYEDQFKG